MKCLSGLAKDDDKHGKVRHCSTCYM